MNFEVNGYNIFIIVAVCFLSSLIFVQIMKKVAIFLKVLDVPNDPRKIHKKPMPLLGGLGIYKYLIEFAGAGATVPLTGFGANLAKGAMESVKEIGILGAFIGGVKASAGGIAAAIFFGYLASLIAKPKIKKQ